MKIIQSFAQFDEGSYYDRDKTNNRILLSYYSFLLSYLTLKKYYNSVTMYCNKKAYENIIKYIPYDEIIILENKHSFKFWSYYKIDVIKNMKTDFIHVDSDVFIFNDLFSPFINSNEYDIIAQNTIKPEMNACGWFVKDNEDFLLKNNIVSLKKYDGRCLSCGTIGMRIEMKDEYIRICETLKTGHSNNELINMHPLGMILEELSFYFLKLKYDLKNYDILPYNEVAERGEISCGNKYKYSHFWFDNKFKKLYVGMIKNKIKKDFPQYYELLLKYESDVINKLNVKCI